MSAADTARLIRRQTALTAINVCDDEIARMCRIESYPNRAAEVARLIAQRDRFVAELATMGVSLEPADASEWRRATADAMRAEFDLSADDVPSILRRQAQ